MIRGQAGTPRNINPPREVQYQEIFNGYILNTPRDINPISRAIADDSKTGSIDDNIGSRHI